MFCTRQSASVAISSSSSACSSPTGTSVPAPPASGSDGKIGGTLASIGDITPVGLGTWALGGARWGPQPEADSLATIERAVARGVGWLDTAPVYGLGRVEELVGRALAGVRERPLLFTKAGLTWEGERISRVGNPAVLRRQCEQSLRRLKTDRIDLYMLHWPPEDGTPVEEA